MDEIFTPNTGDDKMDEAYVNMQMHVSGFNDFEQFFNYFQKVVKTDDKEKLNKWYLKVIFQHLKQPKQQKHKFDEAIELLEKYEPEKADRFKMWLENMYFETMSVHRGGAQ